MQNRPGRPLRKYFNRVSIGVELLSLLVFLIWIQGNMTLPSPLHQTLRQKFSWPWLPFEESSALVRSIADVALMAIFGMIFTALVRKKKRLPEGFHALLVSAALFGVMSSWNSTGETLWAFPAPLMIAPLLFYGFFAAALFYGARPFSRELKMPWESGVLFGMGFFLTNLMSWDRLISAVGVIITYRVAIFSIRRMRPASRTSAS